MIDRFEDTDKPSYCSYNCSATSWANDGTLNGGILEADFADVIYATSGSDKLDGNDEIHGRAGDDTIKGGAGNDYISSSSEMDVRDPKKPTNVWTSPGGKEVLFAGPTWGAHLKADSRTIVWDATAKSLSGSMEW